MRITCEVNMSNSKDIYPGAVFITEKYGKIKVIEYKNKKQVKVEFENTGYIGVYSAANIRRGAIKDWSFVVTGAIHKTNGYGDVMVVEYISAIRVKVMFIDTGHIAISSVSNILRGSLKDPLVRSVCSVGFFGVGKHKSHSNGKMTASYSRWRDMIKRCYDKRTLELHPTYIGCKVCDEWHNFQNFADWYESHKPTDGSYHEIDKDIKSSGLKIYSPENCTIVTRSENASEAANRNFAKTYEFINPNGEKVQVTNLRQFCRESNLDQSAMLRVAKNRQKSHKDWLPVA